MLVGLLLCHGQGFQFSSPNLQHRLTRFEFENLSYVSSFCIRFLAGPACCSFASFSFVAAVRVLCLSYVPSTIGWRVALSPLLAASQRIYMYTCYLLVSLASQFCDHRACTCDIPLVGFKNHRGHRVCCMSTGGKNGLNNVWRAQKRNRDTRTTRMIYSEVYNSSTSQFRKGSRRCYAVACHRTGYDRPNVRSTQMRWNRERTEDRNKNVTTNSKLSLIVPETGVRP